MITLPTLAHADAYTALTLGSGPNDYRSYAFRGNAEVSESVQLNLDYFLSKTPGTDDTRQAGLGFSWQALEHLLVDYRHSNTNDGRVEIKGNEGGLTVDLDPLWQGDLRTALDLGYGDFKYSPARTPPPGTDPTLTQNSSRFGISQEITQSFTLYGSREKYKYDRNVTLIAAYLALHGNMSKAANLLALPDKTDTLGMTWKTSDELTLDATFSKTTTMLKQELKNTRVGLDYQLNDNFNLGAAVTISDSSEKRSKMGVLLQKATRDTYKEITVGWAF